VTDGAAIREGWRDHCLKMAKATYQLADRCDDLEMIGGYLDLAARWLSLADDPRPRRGRDQDAGA
jgi:hypothetical protein